MKKECITINKDGFQEIDAQYYKAVERLEQCQNALHQNPNDVKISDEERQAIMDYTQKSQAFLDFSKHKTRLEWIRDGDQNSALFHKSIKQKHQHNRIYAMRDEHDNWVDSPAGVAEAFLNYYKHLLGSCMDKRTTVKKDIVRRGPLVTNEMMQVLTSPYTKEEVTNAMFSIDCNKAPGLDGFGSCFIKMLGILLGKM